MGAVDKEVAAACGPSVPARSPYPRRLFRSRSAPSIGSIWTETVC